MTLQELHLFLKPRRSGHVIAVEPGYEGSARFVKTGISGRWYTLIAVVPDQAQAWITERHRHESGVVGRTIVDDQQLEVRQRLVQYAGDRIADEVGAIMGWDDDRHEWLQSSLIRARASIWLLGRKGRRVWHLPRFIVSLPLLRASPDGRVLPLTFATIQNYLAAMSVGHAIILAAGQGSRLLPLTLDVPKCLIEVAGKSILRHQVDALQSAGVKSFTVIAGYRADQIERETALYRAGGIHIQTIYNPFWAVASSIGSVWVARERLRHPFLLLNGDTIFDAELLSEALGRLVPGLNLLVEGVGVPEGDDMRVTVREGLVRAVGKDLPVEAAAHRSLGVVASCTPDGAQYLAALDQVLRSESGAHSFHHAIVHCAAQRDEVRAIEIRKGLWQEIDRPEDMARWNADHASDRAA